MARPKKLTIDEELKLTQEKYIQKRKECDELAKKIEMLSKLKQEEMTKKLIDALSRSNKTMEDVLAFINGASSTENDD